MSRTQNNKFNNNRRHGLQIRASGNKKHKNLIILSLVRTVLVLVICYFYFRYDELNTIQNKENSIEYSIKSAKKIHSGSSSYGLMQIEYNKKGYEVEISRTTLANLKNNQEIPILYYEEERDIVFSKYKIIVHRNCAIVFGFFLLLTVIPWRKTRFCKVPPAANAVKTK